MQKKSAIVLIIIVLIVAVGGYAIIHKSYKKTPSTTYNTSNSSNSSSVSSGSGTTVNNSIVLTKSNSANGNYLVDINGNTLYTYSNDTSGVSNCTGSCLSAWPPYQDIGSTANLPTNISTIKRTDDGTLQYTYKGLPLYLFTGDTKGKVNGNGVSGFYVAKP